jgi:hypothetical protein
MDAHLPLVLGRASRYWQVALSASPEHQTDARIGWVSTMTKVAAVLAWVLGLGFGLPSVYAIRYFAKHGRIWTFFGYPTYGKGLFEKVGIATSVPLLASFLLVCVAELVVGWMLWWNHRTGRVFALALLPVELVFWVGFLLPFGPLLGVARTALVLMAWSRRSAPRSG